MGFSVKNKYFVIASSDLGTLVNAFKLIFRNDILLVNKMIIWITKLSTADAEYMPWSGKYKLSILRFEQKQIKPGNNRVLFVLSHRTNGKIFIGPSQDLSKEPKITFAVLTLKYEVVFFSIAL